ncbi:arsenic resistance N-acetyltransferase ArsN2 [Rhizobium azibense]|nr:arsenic resistance N-acetyltransferase ArsN2 [Rhizobium azibense]
MSDLRLEPIPGTDPKLRSALLEAHLPTEDIDEAGRTFFEAVSGDGETLAFSGIESCEGSCLLRSVVVLPEHRKSGIGRRVVELTLKAASDDVFLATTSAAEFFGALGFREVRREAVPAAVLATRQLSSICPSSATIMKLDRPPT